MSQHSEDVVGKERWSTPCTAQRVIDLLYEPCSEISAKPDAEIFIVGKGGEPRWLIDARALKALHVVWRDWTPYSLKSRLAWVLVRTVARLGLLSRLPGVETRSISGATLRDAIEGFPEVAGCAPIVFVGKPSVTAKLTLFMATPQRAIAGIVKIPLTQAASRSIAVEAAAIGELGAKIPGVPRLLGMDAAEGISVQSWLPGRTVARELRQEQIDVLLSLPRGAGVVSLRAATDAVVESVSTVYRERCAGYVSHIPSALTVPVVWEHGDFVPWNMKRRDDGGIQLIDWEYSEQHGLPYLDLCHFFYRQEYLFRDIKVVRKTLDSNELVLAYRKSFLLDPEACRALQLHYLIRCLRMDIPNASHAETYEQFLFRNIEELMAGD